MAKPKKTTERVMSEGDLFILYIKDFKGEKCSLYRVKCDIENEWLADCKELEHAQLIMKYIHKQNQESKDESVIKAP